jgi:hypothetical protein
MFGAAASVAIEPVIRLANRFFFVKRNVFFIAPPQGRIATMVIKPT